MSALFALVRAVIFTLISGEFMALWFAHGERLVTIHDGRGLVEYWWDGGHKFRAALEPGEEG